MPSPKFILLLGALVLALPAAASAQVKTGDMFPSLAAANLTGTVPDLAGKIAVVDFFASWCAPCKASLPVYAKVHADYAAKGVVMVAVGIDETAALHDAFVKKLALPFPTPNDRAHKLVSVVQVPTMPTSYVLGRDGRVRYIHIGFHGAESEKALRQQLDTLLAEKN